MSIFHGKLRRHQTTELITSYIYLEKGNIKTLIEIEDEEEEFNFAKALQTLLNKEVIICGDGEIATAITSIYDIVEDTPKKNYFYGKIVYLNNIQAFRFIDIENPDACLKLSATHKFIKSNTLLASFIDKNVILTGLKVHDYIVFDDIKLLNKEKESIETGDNVALDGVLKISIDGTFFIIRKQLNELDVCIQLFFDPLRQFNDLESMIEKDVSIIGFYGPGNLSTFIVQDIMLCKDHLAVKKKQQNKKPKEKQVNDMYRFEIELD
jgi:hypothetical protein